MVPAGVRDADALRKTCNLIDYLADLTDAANRNPLRDITADAAAAPRPLLWVDEFPEGVMFDAEADDVLLRMRPVRTVPPPSLPEELEGWVDPVDVRSPGDPEPALRVPGGQREDEADIPSVSHVEPAFQRWLARWRAWAEEEPRRARQREFYESLERAAKAIEQRDDECEFVFAAGLVTWRAPDGQAIRRHLLIEHVVPALDRAGVVTVTRLSGKRRIEDRELFEGQEAYRPDRGRVGKMELLDLDAPLASEKMIAGLRDWLGLALDTPFEERDSRPGAGTGLPGVLTFSTSPALLLRPRSRARESEAYQRIADALRQPDAQVPVALAQVVVDTEATQRSIWLEEQGAARGDILGDDPLFPLPANAEQARVIELLRTETGVVVQGPPGTGKTHTIANLVSALLARGQRVLVTSQKDQALRVLREKIPPELRKLCVLLAGGSKDAALELQRGIDALSAAVASTDEATLEGRSRALAAERDRLRAASATLNEQVRALREVELRAHDPVVPGYDAELYRGTLAEIVSQVRRRAAASSWMPEVPESVRDMPPLSADDFAELRSLLSSRSSSHGLRADQEIPDTNELPSVAEFAELIRAERDAQQVERQDTAPIAQQLTRLATEQLDHLESLEQQVRHALDGCGLAEGSAPTGRGWVQRAVRDRLAGQHAGLWQQLLQVREEPERLLRALREQGVGFVIDFRQPITVETLGTARGWLRVGMALLEHVKNGGKLRRRMASRPQKDAQPFLDAVLVDGSTPATAEQIAAALQRIEAEVAAMLLARKWSEVGVPITAGPTTAMLSEIHDNTTVLNWVEHLGALRDATAAMLTQAGITLPLHSLASLFELLRSVPVARQMVELQRLRGQVDALYESVRSRATRPAACPELAGLLAAIAERDRDQYAHGLSQLDMARAEQRAELRCRSLARTLGNVHRRLLGLLESTAGDPVWQERDVAAAWAWSRAQRFVTSHRNADEERRLVAEFESTEDQLKHVTESLAAVEAMRQCLRRLSDDHQRALNTYRAHMKNIGAGTGAKTRELRRAARAAMAKAQDAVPAWVVPLSNLLDNLDAERDRFDVVIVDEASQVGIEHLYLLWMAPRVIVVGDEKQCTPGAGSLGQLDIAFSRNDEYLADIDEDVRRVVTPKSHLYEVLSARAGKGALVRLREHFRCVPEIINWSSSQFYEDGAGNAGLIPLRERTHDGLEPLKVTRVNGAVTEGRDARRRNRAEAEKIVDSLVSCLRDPAYAGKTFGIVVLQNAIRHIQLLEHLVNEAVPPEERQERGIRVGTPPNFQGDERDVVFLSMVVADPPAKATAERFRQSYNVAASRAKDQLWLFTSVGLDQLKPDDLRASLLSYLLNPRPVFGRSPDLEEVSAERRTKPFQSLFEQLVFRELRGRGYHVVPQYPVGARTIDLVVVGSGGRIAVECDGHYWHAGIDQQASDARRDRELARMGWRTVRVRESEFAFDPDRELQQLWQVLDDKDIKPGDSVEAAYGDWEPIALDDTDEVAERI